MNVVVMSGRMVRDNDLKTSSNGKNFCNFVIAVNKAMGKEANFLNCIAFGKTAEFICNYFGKGNMIQIRGKLDVEKWEGRDGTKHEQPKIIVEEADFCGSKKEADPNDNGFNAIQPNQGVPVFVEEDFDEDSLPF